MNIFHCGGSGSSNPIPTETPISELFAKSTDFILVVAGDNDLHTSLSHPSSGGEVVTTIYFRSSAILLRRRFKARSDASIPEFLTLSRVGDFRRFAFECGSTSRSEFCRKLVEGLDSECLFLFEGRVGEG